MSTPMDVDAPTSSSTSAPFRSESVVEADSLESEDDWDWDRQVSSITSSVFDYEYENGRRYHGYKAGVYPLPNDEKELDRLDLQHHVYTLALGGELYLAPLDRPKRVLDIGTGTGLWAILMADKHPEANVLGVDLSPVQPDMVPENAHFEIDDMEAEWLYEPNYFDYIHSRIMIGSISDWKKMLRQSFRHMKPGGYIELQELDPRTLSDDGTDKNSPYNCRFNEEIVKASAAYNKPVPRASELKEMLEEAGFVDVEARYYKLPYNTWPRDGRLKEIGKYQLINYYEGYEAIGIGLFTRALGWTEVEFQVFLANIRNELRDRSIHTYSTFTVVYGRKPPLSTPGRSRQTSPNSGSNSVADSQNSGPSRKIRPPVPLFNDPAPKIEPPPPVLPEVAVATQTQLPTSPTEPDPSSIPIPLKPPTSDRPSYPGKLTFRINRRGEVIRMRDGEEPHESVRDRNTVYEFTVQTGQLNLTDDKADNKEAQSESVGKRRNKEGSPCSAASQEKLDMLKRAQEADEKNPEFQPGLQLVPQEPSAANGLASAPGMTADGGLYFTKKTYAKILAK